MTVNDHFLGDFAPDAMYTQIKSQGEFEVNYGADISILTRMIETGEI
jgi:hypothetical protein